MDRQMNSFGLLDDCEDEDLSTLLANISAREKDKKPQSSSANKFSSDPTVGVERGRGRGNSVDCPQRVLPDPNDDYQRNYCGNWNRNVRAVNWRVRSKGRGEDLGPDGRSRGRGEGPDEFEKKESTGEKKEQDGNISAEKLRLFEYYFHSDLRIYPMRIKSKAERLGMDMSEIIFLEKDDYREYCKRWRRGVGGQYDGKGKSSDGVEKRENSGEKKVQAGNVPAIRTSPEDTSDNYMADTFCVEDFCAKPEWDSYGSDDEGEESSIYANSGNDNSAGLGQGVVEKASSMLEALLPEEMEVALDKDFQVMQIDKEKVEDGELIKLKPEKDKLKKDIVNKEQKWIKECIRQQLVIERYKCNPPSEGWIQVDTHGNIKGGYGAIIHDHEGKLIAAAAGVSPNREQAAAWEFSKHGPVRYHQLEGVKKGLELAIAHKQGRKITVCCESFFVIGFLNWAYELDSPKCGDWQRFQDLLDDVLSLRSDFTVFWFEKSEKQENRAARWLSKLNQNVEIGTEES